MGRRAPVRAIATLLALCLTLPLLAACSSEETLPQACIQVNSDDILELLRQAPERAALADGTPLSACVDHAEDDAQLQTLGLAFVAVADRLGTQAGRGDRAAAFQLGFLLGAAERGAGPTGGTQAELLQRLEQSVAFKAEEPAQQAAVLRGVTAGRRDG